MAELVAQDCKLYVGEYDFSSSANSLSMSYNVEVQDATAFGDTTRTKAPGLLNMNANIEGFFEADVDKVDDILYTSVGVINTIFTMCPTDGSEGETAYSVNGITGTYNPISGTVGEMLKFTAAFDGSGGELVQGTVLANETVTTTDTGTSFQIGTVATGEKIYGIIHVTALSGTDTPTITVIIESDDDTGFASGVTRLSFTAATAITSEFLVPVDGPFTDDWWRASWTVSGTNPSMKIVVSFGIK